MTFDITEFIKWEGVNANVNWHSFLDKTNIFVQQWLATHKEQIELFLLPSYSPELNPTEYLNGDVKQGVHSKPPTRTLAQLKQRLIAHLRKLQKLPSRILKYFEHPCIAYAANKMQAQLVPG